MNIKTGVKTLKLLLLCLFFYTETSAFNISFGSEPAQIASPETNPSQFPVQLPYPAFVQNRKLFMLDPIQKKILIFELIGSLSSSISLDIAELSEHHPIDSFALMQENLFFLVSRKTRSLIMYDAANRKVRLISSADAEKNILLYPADVKKYRNNYFVSDAILRRVGIYSKAGNFLGSISYNGIYPFPFSGDEILYFDHADEEPVRLHKKDIAGRISKFALFERQENEELFQMKLIGMDDEGGLYFEKIAGPSHGVPGLFIVKTDLFGHILHEQKVEVSSESYYHLSHHFLLNGKNWLMQFILKGKGIFLHSLRLPE
jgi:hypothetical protein